MLAGVSTDYYVRLEQGRERRPSDQVLSALAHAFRLDHEATVHLYRLAHPRACEVVVRGPSEEVNPSIMKLLDRWDDVVAFVVNHRLDVLACNPVFAALFDGLEYNDNLLRLTFLNPEARLFYRDWEHEAVAKVAHLRAVAGVDSGDPLLLELVEELSLQSEFFREVWARHEVRAKTHNIVRLHHPEVGDVTLWHETFGIDSAPGLRIFAGQPELGSASQEALRTLTELAPASDGRMRHRV